MQQFWLSHTVHLSGNVQACVQGFLCLSVHILYQAGGQNVNHINTIKIYINNNDKLWASFLNMDRSKKPFKGKGASSLLLLLPVTCSAWGLELCSHTDSGQQLIAEPTAAITKQT